MEERGRERGKKEEKREGGKRKRERGGIGFF